MKIDIDPVIEEKVRTIVKELNSYITDGKWELFNTDCEALLEKFPLNDLLTIGCKLHKLPTTRYLELPYKEITEADINKILINVTKFNSIK